MLRPRGVASAGASRLVPRSQSEKRGCELVLPASPAGVERSARNEQAIANAREQGHGTPAMTGLDLGLRSMNSITADSCAKKAAATDSPAATRACSASMPRHGRRLSVLCWSGRPGPALSAASHRSGGRWTLAPLAPLAHRDHKTMLGARDLPESADRTPVSRAPLCASFRRRLLYRADTVVRSRRPRVSRDFHRASVPPSR